MRLLLKNCHIVDATSPQARRDQHVLVEDGRISRVGKGRAPAADQTIDLEGAYLLPGLWDVQTQWPGPPNLTVAENAAQFGQNAMEGLTQAGVVGIRTGGVPDFIDVAWRNAFNAGQFTGPRIFASGWFLTTTAGHALTSGFAKECDGPYGFVKAIRENIKNGVNQIKLNLTGGIMGPPWNRHWLTFPMEEELKAAFAICHQRGYKIMAHAAHPEAVKWAVRNGASSIEHGYILDEEALGLMVEHNVYWVPTLQLTHLTRSQAMSPWEKRIVEQRNLPPELVQRAEDAVEVHRTWFQQALRAGVKMALGSNIRPLKEGVLVEMALWVKDGATPHQAIVAATKNAADLCGVGKELGTVEPGKLADLIAVRQDPLEDITNLRSPELVFKEGRIVADRRK